MGIFTVPIVVGDLEWQRTTPLEALVDTGTTFSAVPSSVLYEMGVEPIVRREVEFAHGEVREFAIGWIRMLVEAQNIITPVMFNEEGTEPLLGAVALEEALLGIDPVGQRLILMRARG
jgi:predicted aspartyl protease